MSMTEPIKAPVAIDTSALVAASAPKTTASAPADKMPCNWDLKWEGDVLVGKNIVTGHDFEGTKAEFQEMLRG